MGRLAERTNAMEMLEDALGGDARLRGCRWISLSRYSESGQVCFANDAKEWLVDFEEPPCGLSCTLDMTGDHLMQAIFFLLIKKTFFDTLATF